MSYENAQYGIQRYQPRKTKQDLSEVIQMSNLKAQTENATAHAKGFVAENVVTYAIAAEHKAQGYKFCLRLLEFDSVGFANIAATDRELYSIMSNQSGGSGLMLMPLIKAKTTTPSDDLKSALERLEELGLPLNMTIWLDEESLKTAFTANPEKIKEYKDEWSKNVIAAGYSVGYYKGGIDDCECPSTSDSGNSVLSAVECGTSSSSTLKSITIGNNTGSCKIRWAYLGSSQ